jgi:putative transposase
MSQSQAVALQVSPPQQALLEQLVRRQTADQRLVRRAALIRALAANPCVQAVARQQGLTRLTVRHWRQRWLEASPALEQAERNQATPQQLARLLEQVLADAPRPGAPATFSPEQIVQVAALACEPPAKSGRPISHWTSRELAGEAKKRQLVKAISPRTVGRFLKRGRPAASQESLLAQR